MDFLLWMIFGALSGWMASLLLHSDQEQAVFFDIIIGVVGALVGGFVMNLLGSPGVAGFNLYSLTVAILGSVILLAVVRAIRT